MSSSWTWIGHPVSGLQRTNCALLRLAFASAPCLKHLTIPYTTARRTVLQKVRRYTSYMQAYINSAPAVCRHRISGSLSLPSRGPFHLSFTVLCAIGHWVVFSLTGWSPHVPTKFRVCRGTPDTACYCRPSCTGLSPSMAGFPKTVPLNYLRFMQSLPQGARTLVWAPPVSLAATPGITVVFFSSGYLDVSVRRVPFVKLCIRLTMTEVCSAGFPHSDIRGSQDMCSSPRLFAAYHVFLRLPVPRHPSCALSCFTICPRSLIVDLRARSAEGGL